ncbi:MAG: CDGSH iron-sulfur domain-containing protein [Gammaproteobacteria bacterium]|nr:CDGSH iron-sulfur domain-containing protein [Gammaproteobacteria bacterium]
MSNPLCPKNSPYVVNVVAGKDYYWCSCGNSTHQPFCDGAHKGTEFGPTVFTAEKTEAVYLCDCKKTTNAPYCDGSHME